MTTTVVAQARRTALVTATPRRRFLALAGGLVFGLVLAGLVVVGGAPTGARTAEGVLPPGDRVAARAGVGDVVVMVVAHGTERYLVVAHRGAKGWFGLRPPRPQPGAPVAWTATPGNGTVPALSAAYGRAAGGSRAVVTWADGRTQVARVALDGTWLAARAGRVALREAKVVDARGDVVAQVAPR